MGSASDGLLDNLIFRVLTIKVRSCQSQKREDFARDMNLKLDSNEEIWIWQVYGIEFLLEEFVLFWGEAEKNSFVALRGKGGHSGIVPLKTVCPNLERTGEEFYSGLKWFPDLL